MAKISVELERLANGRWIGRITGGGYGRGVELKTDGGEEVVFQAIREAVARVTSAPPPLPMMPSREFEQPSPRFPRHAPRDATVVLPVEQPAAAPIADAAPPQIRRPLGKKGAALMRHEADEMALAAMTPATRDSVITRRSQAATARL